MESDITKILNAYSAHSTYSSSELQLFTEYFCDSTDMSSEDASDSGEEFAISDDSNDDCSIASQTKKRKLSLASEDVKSWNSVSSASVLTKSALAESTAVLASEDLFSNLDQSTSELVLPIIVTEMTLLTSSPNILESNSGQSSIDGSNVCYS